MKAELEPQDIQQIAEKVVELLKPYLLHTASGEDRIMDKKECAEYLHVDVSWIDKNIHALPRFHAGKYVRFKQSKIDRWIETLTIAPSPRLALLRKLK
jgi:predicted DNA-binding transcriptional regulator AlpA